jgi:hypothetical protein
MALREREALDAIQLGFLIPPLPSIFQANAAQVLTKAVRSLKASKIDINYRHTKLLKAFINHLLFTIYHEDLAEIPKADYWGLEGNEGGFIDLDGWDPRQTRQDVYKVIALPVSSDPRTLNPISTEWAVLGGGSWPPSVKSIQLPSRELFEIRGPHLLLVIHWRVRVRISNKRTKIEETRNTILIPADLKVIDLIKAFKVGSNVSGFFKISDFNNIQTTDTRTAAELGWKHGTELRLEML